MGFLKRYGSGLLGNLCLVLGLSGCMYETDEIMARGYQYEGIRGWSQGGKLVTGGLIVPSGATDVNLIRGSGGVSMQAALQEEDSLTTQFNISGNVPANAQADITSSVGGNEIRRVITVADGAAITTRGMNVRVVVRDFTDSSINTGNEYNVQIVSTLGVRANFKQPPFLVPLVYRVTAVGGVLAVYQGSILIPPTIESFVPLPNDAGINSVFISVISADPTVVFAASEISARSYTSAALIINQYSPIGNPDWVPITPNTAQIGILNSAAGANAVVSVFFGIDG